MPKIALVLTTLNELEGSRVIFPKIDLSLFSGVMVLDGKSNDGTIDYFEEQGIEVLIQSRPGFRFGMYEMYEVMKTREIDYILTFSPDGNCDPATLPNFVKFCNGDWDLIIGSRYKDDARSDDDDFLTALGNIFFTRMTNLLFGSRFTDVFSIYRAFTLEAVESLMLQDEYSYLPMERFFKTKLGWEPLMSFRAARLGLRVAEVAVGEPRRIGGERKLQVFKWGASFLAQLLRELWYRPERRVNSGKHTY